MTFRLFPLLAALGLAVVASSAAADTLLMERTQK
jgi:hypothetical protein